MLVFKVLHVLFMFAAVTLLVGEHLFYAAAVWLRDVRALAAIRRLSRAPLYLANGAPVVAVGLLLAGVVFGLLTALTGGLDFFAGWLIAAYVLMATILVPAVKILGALVNQLEGGLGGPDTIGDPDIRTLEADVAAVLGLLPPGPCGPATHL